SAPGVNAWAREKSLSPACYRATAGANASVSYEERSAHYWSHVVALSQTAMPCLRRRLNRSASFPYQEKLHRVRRDLQARRRILCRGDYGERRRYRSLDFAGLLCQPAINEL